MANGHLIMKNHCKIIGQKVWISKKRSRSLERIWFHFWDKYMMTKLAIKTQVHRAIISRWYLKSISWAKLHLWNGAPCDGSDMKISPTFKMRDYWPIFQFLALQNRSFVVDFGGLFCVMTSLGTNILPKRSKRDSQSTKSINLRCINCSQITGIGYFLTLKIEKWDHTLQD